MSNTLTPTHSSRCCLTQVNWKHTLTRPWKLINGAGCIAKIQKIMVTALVIIASLGLLIIPMCVVAIQKHFIHKSKAKKRAEELDDKSAKIFEKDAEFETIKAFWRAMINQVPEENRPGITHVSIDALTKENAQGKFMGWLMTFEVRQIHELVIEGRHLASIPTHPGNLSSITKITLDSRCPVVQDPDFVEKFNNLKKVHFINCSENFSFSRPTSSSQLDITMTA